MGERSVLSGMKRTRGTWDDDGNWYGPSYGHGSIHDLADSEPVGETAAILWVPDPEQRHGWREYYVRHAKPNAKPRTMGFKTGKSE